MLSLWWDGKNYLYHLDDGDPVTNRSLIVQSGIIKTTTRTWNLSTDVPTSFEFDGTFDFTFSNHHYILSHQNTLIIETTNETISEMITYVSIQLAYNGSISGFFTETGPWENGLTIDTGSLNISEIRTQAFQYTFSTKFRGVSGPLVSVQNGQLNAFGVDTDEVYLFYGRNQYFKIHRMNAFFLNNYIVSIQDGKSEEPLYFLSRRVSQDVLNSVLGVEWPLDINYPNGTTEHFETGDYVSVSIEADEDGFVYLYLRRFNERGGSPVSYFGFPIYCVINGKWRSNPGTNLNLLLFNNFALDDGTRIFQEGDAVLDDETCLNSPKLLGVNLTDLNTSIWSNRIEFTNDENSIVLNLSDQTVNKNGQILKLLDIRQYCYTKLQGVEIEEEDIIQKQTKSFTSVQPETITITREPSEEPKPVSDDSLLFQQLITKVYSNPEIQRLLNELVSEEFKSDEWNETYRELIETFATLASEDEDILEQAREYYHYPSMTSEELKQYIMYPCFQDDYVPNWLNEHAADYIIPSKTSRVGGAMGSIIDIGNIFLGSVGNITLPRTRAIDGFSSAQIGGIFKGCIANFFTGTQTSRTLKTLRFSKTLSKDSEETENSFNEETGELKLVETCQTLDFVDGEIKSIVSDDSLICFTSNVNLQGLSLQSLPKRVIGGDFKYTFRECSFDSDLELELKTGTYEGVFQECDFNNHSVKLTITGEVSLKKMFENSKNLKSLEISGGRIHSLESLVSCSKELESLKITSQLFGEVNFRRMCFCCKSLKDVDLTQSEMELYDGNFEGMFFCCKSLKNCDLKHSNVFCFSHPNVSFMYSFNTGTLLDSYFDFSNTFLFNTVNATKITFETPEGAWYQKQGEKVLLCSSDGVLQEFTENDIWMPIAEDGERLEFIQFKPVKGEFESSTPMTFETIEEYEKNIFRNIEVDRYLIEHQTGIPTNWMIWNADYPN